MTFDDCWKMAKESRKVSLEYVIWLPSILKHLFHSILDHRVDTPKRWPLTDDFFGWHVDFSQSQMICYKKNLQVLEKFLDSFHRMYLWLPTLSRRFLISPEYLLLHHIFSISAG